MGGSRDGADSMYPLLFGALPSYAAMWAIAAATCITVGSLYARRAGFALRQSAAALALLALSILLGSKLLWLAESYWYPEDDYVPLALRGLIHGFRIPGGIVMLALATPIACRALSLPWREFGDRVIPLAALALVLIRLGCFLNGCCFGKVSGLPWAFAFPRGNWVFWYHRTHGWIAGDAHASLPVHPLQVYFMLAALIMFAIVGWYQRVRREPGSVQLLFYALFFTTSAVLEPFRQNYLTLNTWLAPIAATVSAGVFAGRILGQRQAPRAGVVAHDKVRDSRMTRAAAGG
jgi:phosphatidylglycerol:prolipoprotein diacylglycerol transferase